MKFLKEQDIQKSIFDYLNLKRYFCWKNSSVGIYVKKTGHYIPAQTRGIPDIFVLHDGILYGIEVKTKKGVVSPHQKEFLDKLSEYGGIAIIARSIDDVMKIL